VLPHIKLLIKEVESDSTCVDPEEEKFPEPIKFEAIVHDVKELKEAITHKLFKP
jgi:hypothetical protein